MINYSKNLMNPTVHIWKESQRSNNDVKASPILFARRAMNLKFNKLNLIWTLLKLVKMIILKDITAQCVELRLPVHMGLL